MLVDTAFDFRTDATTDDPDQSSPTLRRYHQLLWSKPLPNGHCFDLDTTTAWTYLHHISDIGEFFLSSDSVIAKPAGMGSWRAGCVETVNAGPKLTPYCRLNVDPPRVC